MVMMTIYQATLIRLCQANAWLQGETVGHIFFKLSFVIHQWCRELYWIEKIMQKKF